MNSNDARMHHNLEQLSAAARDYSEPAWTVSAMDMAILVNFALIGAAATAVKTNEDKAAAAGCAKTLDHCIRSLARQVEKEGEMSPASADPDNPCPPDLRFAVRMMCGTVVQIINDRFAPLRWFAFSISATPPGQGDGE